MYRKLKIVCITNRQKSLTKARIYETRFSYSRFDYGKNYECINDQGVHQQYHKSNFMLLEDYRKQQISKILNL